jgi:MFS family permease
MVRSVSLLLVAQVLVLSLWFSASAVIPSLAASHDMLPYQLAGLLSATQIGFVIGALVFAITGLPDRMPPQILFATAAILAALLNLVLLVVSPSGVLALASRVLVGFCLAGVYPVGLKIAVGWSEKRRGLITSLLVGALALGSALPYAVALLGGVDWRVTLWATSLLACAGAVAVWFTSVGPFHRQAAQFNPKSILTAWNNRAIRSAFLGYFGHMWEVYAFWAWVGVAVSAAAVSAGRVDANSFGSLTAFVAISAGALACVPAGLLADRFGKVVVARSAMVLSAGAGLMAALTFDGNLMVFVLVMVFWSAAIVPDSPQFSALVADHAPPDQVGSLMTLQTAIGFLVTCATIQIMPEIVTAFGWPTAFVFLAIGPVFGVWIIGQVHRIPKSRS